MPHLLILTVGTGTAGAAANITQGLINTIHKVNPRNFWLIPSTAADSLAVAALIAETFPGSFAPWTGTDRFKTIEDPDQLESSRQVVREVIRTVRRRLQQGERLLVNPTSGTKQMSAGATLAALDEQIGDIIFTVGNRQDGVVITGTERITAFDPESYFEERDLRLARQLFDVGSWDAAARVLAPHQTSQEKARHICLCRLNWSRLSYGEAARHAARFSEPHRVYLKQLADLTEAQIPAAAVLTDLLSHAEEFLALENPDASFQFSYKSLEYALRLELFLASEIRPPYTPNKFQGIRTDLTRNAVPNQPLRIGQRQMADLLKALGSPVADRYFQSQALEKGLSIRNRLTHEIRPTTTEEARNLLAAVRSLCEHFELPTPIERPSLP
jgi:hypothetical protein